MMIASNPNTSGKLTSSEHTTVAVMGVRYRLFISQLR